MYCKSDELHVMYVLNVEKLEADQSLMILDVILVLVYL